MIEALFLLTLSVAPAQTPPTAAADSLERVARAAGRRYEYLLRRLIPYRRGGGFGGDCHEIIGRFCFRFDDGDDDPTPEPPPPPEDPGIGEARVVAVRAHRRWFAVEPAASHGAGMAVRYLVEEGRAREALAAARTHAWAAGRSPGSLMLVGLALHYSGEFPAAEAVFDSARAAMEVEERRRLDDLGVLLDREERDHYRELSGEERTAYERLYWTLADPSLLQPGNERRSGHYARHAWIRILSEAPRVAGMLSWGDDHEEILLRYGLPTSRERIRADYPGMLLESRVSLVESFDPLAVSLGEASLVTEGVPVLEEPDPRRRLERDSARSSYAPVLLERMRSLTLQQSRFPAGDRVVLRVDAALPPDTTAPRVPTHPRALLAAFDTLGRELARVESAVLRRPDSTAVFTAELTLPPGRYTYRVELADDSTGLAGLAQHGVRLVPPLGLTLSDLLVTSAFGDSLPRSRDALGRTPLPLLVLPPGRSVGIYAEAWDLTPGDGGRRYAVEWWLESAEQGPLLARALGWLGRTLGLVGEDEPLRVRWEDAADSRRAAIAFNLDLQGAEPGLYRLGLRVTDRVSGEVRNRTRLIRIAAGPVDGYGRAPD